MEKAVITIVGSDRTGILAAASAVVAKANGNVLNVDMNVNNDIFSMVMSTDVTKLNVSITKLQNEVSASVPDMVVHVMHENIFNAMHTI